MGARVAARRYGGTAALEPQEARAPRLGGRLCSAAVGPLARLGAALGGAFGAVGWAAPPVAVWASAACASWRIVFVSSRRIAS